jgi:hypothetical protein
MDKPNPLANESKHTDSDLTVVRSDIRELKEIVTKVAELAQKSERSKTYEAKVLYQVRDEVGELRKDLPLAKQDVEHGDKLYGITSLSKRWDVSERTIAKEVSEGNLVPTYIRTSLRFTPEAVCAYERTATGMCRRRGARERAAAKSSS